MSRGMLRVSMFGTGSWILSLIGAAAMHGPKVQGATVLAEFQDAGPLAQVMPYSERVGLNIRDEAFETQHTGLGFDGSWNVENVSVTVPIPTPPIAWEAGSAGLGDTSMFRLTLDVDSAASSTVAPDASPSNSIHWLAFERRWLLPQSSSLDEALPVARAASPVAPRIAPLVNSSPIPLLPATRSALALGVAASIVAMIKRGRRALR